MQKWVLKFDNYDAYVMRGNNMPDDPFVLEMFDNYEYALAASKWFRDVHPLLFNFPENHDELMAIVKKNNVHEWWNLNWFYNNSGCVMPQYMHSNPEKPTELRYMRSYADACRGKWTTIAPGRWLGANFAGGVLSTNDVTSIATEYVADRQPIELKITKTPAEVETVYRKGPSSCMSHPLEHYKTETHPSRVYSSPDVAVGYIERAGKITARCVLNLNEKSYGRIYGDETRMQKALKASEFNKKGNLIGCRLPMIEDDKTGGYVMPYIDYEPAVKVSTDPDGQKWFEVVSSRATYEYIAQTTDGVIAPNTIPKTCPSCQRKVARNAMRAVRVSRSTDERWCSTCRGEKAFYCDGTDHWYSNATFERVSMPDGYTYASSYSGIFTCPVTKAWAYTHNAISLITSVDVTGRQIAQTCANNTPYEIIDGRWFTVEAAAQYKAIHAVPAVQAEMRVS